MAENRANQLQRAQDPAVGQGDFELGGFRRNLQRRHLLARGRARASWQGRAQHPKCRKRAEPSQCHAIVSEVFDES